MSAAVDTLIQSLTVQGVCLSRRGDKLRVEAPRGVLTDELRHVLLAQKREILSFLSSKCEVRRAIINFRLIGTQENAWATALGAPGEDLDALIQDLRARHGKNLILGEAHA